MKTYKQPYAMKTFTYLLNTVKKFINVKLLLFSITIILYSCTTGNTTPPPAPLAGLPVLTIERKNATINREYPATIEASANIEVRAQVDGVLEMIYVDEGAAVKKGQLLFKINDRPYQEQLNQAQANLLSAQAELENAELEVEKKTRLVDHKILTDFPLKSAKSARQAAGAKVKLALSAVESAKINLDYTLIRASTNGYIGRLLKKQGSLISFADQQPLTVLSNVEDLHVYFSLGENDFIEFKNSTPGDNLQAKIANLPPVNLLLSDQRTYEHPGKIDMVDGQFDKNTGAITLRATFKNPQGVLRNGNTGKILIPKSFSETMLVPQLSTVEIQDKIFVYVLTKDNKVKQQPIEVVGKNGQNYLVSTGVNHGDQIVYKGIDLLQDGQSIFPQPLAKDSIL